MNKFDILKAMHTLALSCNDEGFYWHYWVHIIPDGADEYELEEIAESDRETFNDAVKCFIQHFGRFAKEGGLYAEEEDEVYPKEPSCLQFEGKEE